MNTFDDTQGCIDVIGTKNQIQITPALSLRERGLTASYRRSVIAWEMIPFFNAIRWILSLKIS